MKIHLEYFAVLRECAGKSAEELETTAANARDLYNELTAQYHFPISAEHIAVAINEKFASFDAQLSEGDTVVFIAPVSGG